MYMYVNIVVLSCIVQFLKRVFHMKYKVSIQLKNARMISEIFNEIS